MRQGGRKQRGATLSQERGTRRKGSVSYSNPFGHEALGVLFQDAAVLDDLKTRFSGAARGLFVDDAFLHPDHSGALLDGALDELRDEFRPAKDHHDVNRGGYCVDSVVGYFAEYRPYVWVNRGD